MSQVAAQAEAFREFNRFFTRAVGVLTDRYLGRDRPLSESRLLFEIGAGGATVRDLRERLGLDSGYLSRLLGSLQGQGLVTVRSRPADNRARIAALTPYGRAELAELNERATAVAAGLLTPLTDRQRGEVITAMEPVRRRLRLAAITIEVADPAGPPARWCLDQYAEEIDQRFPGGFDRGESQRRACDIENADPELDVAAEQARGRADASVLCPAVAGQRARTWTRSGASPPGGGRPSSAERRTPCRSLADRWLPSSAPRPPHTPRAGASA